MEDLKCPICGEPTSVYMGKARRDRLCKKHGTLAKKGEIEQCFLCYTWYEAGETCPICNSQKTSNTSSGQECKCIVCGEPSRNKPQCKTCYYESRDFIETLDKNSNVRQLRDHYYNLKERIVIIKTLEEARRQCNRLIAIAMLANELYNDTSLIDRVYRDVESLLEKKQTDPENSTYQEERKENDETKSKVNTAQDGHVVDSDMEVRIDDLLYNACILHCYGKSVEEIPERRKKCDWFIPIVNGKGIYIEYWGMKTPKYLEERAKREALYKKYDIPYIGIEADDPKKDTSTFRSNLIRELRKLAEERYGFMPEWKK